jgi:hypothetical protein
MNYIERNATLIAEINSEVRHGLKFDKKWTVGSRSGTQYSTLGSYDSKTMGRTVYLGLKESTKTDPELATFMTLAIIRAVIAVAPEYESEIPVLHGRLLSTEKGGNGVIVEDVSEGGKVKVREMDESLDRIEGVLPEKLKLMNPYLVNEDLAVASFQVGEKGERRLLDFLGLRSGLVSREVIEKIPFIDLYDNIERHTVYTSQKF